MCCVWKIRIKSSKNFLEKNKKISSDFIVQFKNILNKICHHLIVQKVSKIVFYLMNQINKLRILIQDQMFNQ